MTRTSVNCWTIILEEDPETGDLILPLPDDLVELWGTKVGDTVKFEVKSDGVYITKVDNPDIEMVMVASNSE